MRTQLLKTRVYYLSNHTITDFSDFTKKNETSLDTMYFGVNVSYFRNTTYWENSPSISGSLQFLVQYYVYENIV